jgi:hypothetical protein
VPTIEHAGVLDDLVETPAYLMPEHAIGVPRNGGISCCFCGVGDSGLIEREGADAKTEALELSDGAAQLEFDLDGRPQRLAVQVSSGTVLAETPREIAPRGGVLLAGLVMGERRLAVALRETGRVRVETGELLGQQFRPYQHGAAVVKERITGTRPTSGCIKLKHSTFRQRAAYPIHIAPSRLDPGSGRRQTIGYADAIAQLADLLLAHRPSNARTLVYASGQLDYFAIFAMQEVLRLLGVRNLTGNAEHCLNAGAVHNEILTGQEGPFLTIEQAMHGPGRFYLFNGWNGFAGWGNKK